MGPIVCPETSVRKYYYSLRNNPEERSVQPPVTDSAQQPADWDGGGLQNAVWLLYEMRL